MSALASVNLAVPAPNPSTGSQSARTTGIGKVATDTAVEVRDPGPKRGGLGSGLVGDYVADARHHGGSDQAVYVFAREDLDRWQDRLGRVLPNGFFGENFTTVGVDVNGARIGERWRVGGTAEFQVTAPRIPCATFRGWVGEKGWLKLFTQDGRPGTYLRVVTPGTVRAGDPVTVVHRPAHDVTVARVFRAELDRPGDLPGLIAAREDMIDELREVVERACAAQETSSDPA